MRRLDVVFFAVVLVMAAHEAEHVAQVVQKDALANTCPTDCRGLLGFVFDIEWVHVAYNHSLLLLLAGLYLGYRMWRREWRERNPAAWALITGGVFGIQAYHVVEHTAKLEQWFSNDHQSPTPGLLGQLLPPPRGTNFSLVELHFTFNTLVFLCVVSGYFIYRFGPRPRLAAGAVAGLLVLPVPIAWATRTPTAHLAAGVHQGPLVLSHGQKLIGADGAVVRGGIRITASNVTVRNVAVVGGEHGIEIDGAKNVALERVMITGSRLDGINARASSVAIRDCVVHSLAGPQAQGIDISFSAHLKPSLVSGCTVTGGSEGIVTNHAHVAIRRNRVRGTTFRAITMTEMSMGAIEKNEVSDALGVGIFCGDYSLCEVHDNTVRNTRSDRASENRSRMGFAIVAHYGASAEISGNRLHGSPGGAAAFLSAELKRS